MAIYEITPDKIVAFLETSFGAAGLKERGDLQRLLKAQVDVVCPDVLVVSEGFREWEDSRREIDLLAIDTEANLVVIELKRTEDAGHAELQAIRYAAMVSAMTFEKTVEVYGDYLRKNGSDADAASALLEFLDWPEPDEDSFAQDVRIVLVAADFSKELTTSVMWLNERALDIRCVRLRPYRDGTRTLIDVQQVIPLPEAEDYIIRIREKAARERKDRTEQALRQEFWRSLLERCSQKTELFAQVSPSQKCWLGTGSGVSGIQYTYYVQRNASSVRLGLWADKEVNKARFDWLHAKREELENAFGGEFEWLRCNELKHSRIGQDLEGGYRNDPEQWPKIQDRMIDSMVRLQNAIQPHLAELRNITSANTEEEGEEANEV